MKKNTKESTCAFYASDYHFEMISLPYINERMEKKEEIVILTENNLQETIKTVLEKTNLKEEKKQKILKINWKNNDLDKLKAIKSKIEEQKKITIFIKGKKNYIHNVNQNIEKWVTKNKNVKVIDCYDMEEIGEEIEEIMQKYHQILKTSGKKEIEKI